MCDCSVICLPLQLTLLLLLLLQASAVATVSVGNVPFTSTLLRKMGGTVGPPGYRITFHTSNVVMAGTSAAVFFELIGENGSSSELMGD